MAQTWLEQFIEWIYNTFTKPITDYFKKSTGDASKFYAMRMLSEGETWEEVNKLYPDLKREDFPEMRNVAEVAFKALIDGSQALATAGLAASETLQPALQSTAETLGKLITAPFTTWMKTQIQNPPTTKSRILYTDAQLAGIALVGGSAAAIGVTHIVGQLLDATQPVKGWGFQSLVGHVAQVAGVTVPAGFVLSPYFRSWVTEPIARFNREEYEETDLAKVVFDELLLRRYLTVEQWHEWVKKLGYPTNQRDLAVKLISTEIPLRTLRMVHKFDPYPDDELTTLIKRLGYDLTQIPKLLKYVKEGSTPEEKVLAIGNWLEALEKGLRTEAIVRKKLEDFGYDSESIQLALDLHVVKALDTERDVLDSEVKSAFSKGIVTEQRAREMWTSLRYDAEAIEIKVQLVNWQKEQAQKDVSVSTYERLYVAGQIDRRAFFEKLGELGLSAEGITTELASADLKMTIPIDRLSKSEVLAAFKAQVRDQDWTEKRLRDMNVPEDDLSVLLALHAPKVAA